MIVPLILSIVLEDPYFFVNQKAINFQGQLKWHSYHEHLPWSPHLEVISLSFEPLWHFLCTSPLSLLYASLYLMYLHEKHSRED